MDLHVDTISGLKATLSLPEVTGQQEGDDCLFIYFFKGPIMASEAAQVRRSIKVSNQKKTLAFTRARKEQKNTAGFAKKKKDAKKKLQKWLQLVETVPSSQSLGFTLMG